MTYAVQQILKLAAISDGTYQKPASIDLQATNATFHAMNRRTPSVPGVYTTENNGWSIISTEQQGVFQNGTDFLTRSYFGIDAYLDNTFKEAIYPMPSINEFQLQPNEALMLSFSRKPPVGNNGFWSVTAYDAAGFLIPNSQNKYTVGDRSNITYPDGTLIYPDYMHATFNSSARNDPFQILVQGANTPPPANWTQNWLPVIANGSKFTLTFRLYDPTMALIEGEYVYPVISRQSAITE